VFPDFNPLLTVILICGTRSKDMSAQRNSSGAYALLLSLHFIFVTRCIFKKQTENVFEMCLCTFYTTHTSFLRISETYLQLIIMNSRKR
jgi:hypothetical protein